MGISIHGETKTIGKAETLESATIYDGGVVNVMDDGKLKRSEIGAKGRVNVSSGGSASSTKITSGVMNVFNGGTARDTNIINGQLCLYDGGYAEVTNIQSGSLDVFSGGTANNNSLAYGGTAITYDGGRLNSTTVSSGGSCLVSGGTAFVTLVHSRGYLHLFDKGFAENTTVSSGGNFLVSGGTAVSTVVSRNGRLTILPGGRANYATVNGSGRFTVSSGGTATGITILDGALLDFTVAPNTLITGTAGGSAFEIDNGQLANYTVNSGVTFNVIYGGLVDRSTVNGGIVYVGTAGTVSNTVLNRGTIFVYDEGVADGLIVSSGAFSVSDKGRANHIVVSLGGIVSAFRQGFVNDATIHSGGRLSISSGGILNGASVSGGQLVVDSLGQANDILVLSGGALQISAGGSVATTTVLSGAVQTVSHDGKADTTTVLSGGSLVLEAGGSATETSVNDGGYLKIASGGQATATTIQNGGKLLGYFNCEDVTFDSGASLYFDISDIEPGNQGALVNLTGLAQPENYSFKLLISDSQRTGTYRLAEGAGDFAQTISVTNDVLEFASLAANQTVQINSKEYALSLDNGNLTLTVSAPTAQYVYLDFDGEAQAQYGNPDLGLSFDVSVTAPTFSDDQRTAIVSELSRMYDKYNIAFTLERPQNVEYSTLYFGQSTAFANYGDFFGVSETYDGNNQNHSDNAFVLLDQNYSSGQVVSVASHLLDNLLGLSYFAVDGAQDLSRYAENKELLSLSSAWTQGDPYNKYCPIDPRNDQRCVTGCTNNAGSQIIYYWLEKGLLDLTLSLNASDAYQCTTNVNIESSDNPTNGHLSFTDTNNLLSDFRMEDADCIAALCFAAGVVQKAQYSSGETGAFWNKNLFIRAGLSPSVVDKYYTVTHWPEASESYVNQDTRLSDTDPIISDLLQGRPVAATISSIGHAVVIDGYDSANNTFHVNYGWGEERNQWCTLGQLVDLKIDEALYGIAPVVSPDLTVESLSVSATAGGQDGDVTLSFTIANEGKEVSTPTIAYVYCGDNLLEFCGLDYISPGYSRDCTCTVNLAALPTGESTLTVKIGSQNGNGISEKSLEADITPPDAPVASADITAPTNQSVIVGATFSADSDLKEYSTDGMNWNAYTQGVVMADNGTVSFRATDAAGNVSDITTYAVTNIDKTAPESPIVSADMTAPTNQSVIVGATFSTDSDLKEYSTDGVNWSAYTQGVVMADNGTVSFRATDTAGNVSDITTYAVSNIDKTAPESPIVSADMTAPTNQSVIVGATFSADSDLKEYSTDGVKWSAYTQGVVMADNGTVSFRATDTAGNVSDIMTYVVTNIDKTAPDAPTFSLSGDKNTSEVVVTANWDADDADCLYAVDDSDNWQTYTAPLRFQQDAIVHFKTMDAAGNESTVGNCTVKTTISNEELKQETTEDGRVISTWADDDLAAWSDTYDVQITLGEAGSVVIGGIAGQGIELYNAPGGDLEVSAKPSQTENWTEGETITVTAEDTAPRLVTAVSNGIQDVMFGRATGTWNGCFAINANLPGTRVKLNGLNRIEDIYLGSDDASLLLLSDDANGDALFLDDLCSAFSQGCQAKARLAQIDEIRAGAGNDVVDLTSRRFAYAGGLTVRGGAGDDVLWAYSGENRLYGDAGNDRLVGASGDDILVGGAGDDAMHGGGGKDIFAFGTDWGNDTVEQFADGQVTLWFADGDLSKWDSSTLTYTDGTSSVKVSGVAENQITLKFGGTGEDAEQFAALSADGAFLDATSERIFENHVRGTLA